jgi:type I restriction-modification system DNA methylase subunit
MPLFNPKALRTAHSRPATPAEIAAAREWAARAASDDLDLQNESQLEQEFNRTILQGVLGYTAPGAGQPGTMRVKQPIPGGTTVDVALGRFDGADAAILAPFELKGPKTQLDRIMPGRNKTPVQQAWDYAMDAAGARWVLLSNMKEVRLYAFGHGRLAYEPFDLKRLGEEGELRRFQLLLHADQLLTGRTADLLRRSADADRDITDKLYLDYRALRTDLGQFVRDRHPAIAPEDRIRIIQTLLDRLLFIAFAEDKRLLPERSLAEAVSETNKFNPLPKWEQLRTLFAWVDKGAPPHEIPRYNGGLFKFDPVIDSLDLPDHLVERFALLGGYDFESEISVTILGHIFEQSITDIEREKAEARLEAPPSATKKKREGVVYTPDFITRFIVERTIGAHLAEITAALLPGYGRIGADGEIVWRGKTGESDFWAAYLARLAALRVLDPACGSGAFLIAAFDFLYAEQKRVRDRLSELNPRLLAHADDNADVQIVTNSLFGVDVNAESVEITKLALWLQTARRDRALESLDGNIKHGNSLVDDPAFPTKAFNWRDEFGAILDGKDGGFDIVLGNPPYVRMELVKPIKPHLQKHFAVAADRADLYAYFFELGLRMLKPGGRLGFISSSTFFRTGSGKPLRDYLATTASVEAVVDFGDLQVFEGVTTYPAIVILKNEAPAGDGILSYLNVRALPDDLGKAFDDAALPMPRARLGAGTWRFESDRLDAIRAKMAAGRKTLKEVYGAPLYGIKTGFNRAFVLERDEHDAIVARAAQTPGDRSAELLKPFLVGEDLKRWHVEGGERWLIYTPKKTVNIDAYPAVRDHLTKFREQLEARATKQEWWELQQAQAAYATHFDKPKTVWPHFQDRASFSVEAHASYLNNKCFFWPGARPGLAAALNSNLYWFLLSAVAREKRGGYIEAEAQYVETLPAISDEERLAEYGDVASVASRELHALRLAVRHRLGDLCPAARSSRKFRQWPDWDFDRLQAELRKLRKKDIPLQQRDEWEHWYNKKRAEAASLARQIAEAEARINAEVYRNFDLTVDEIAAIEDELALTSPSLTLKSYEAISAIEGIELNEAERRRLRTKAASAGTLAA